MPAAPADFGRPVAVPEIAVGQNAKAALGRTRGALFQANCRLAADAALYDGVQAEFRDPGVTDATEDAADAGTRCADRTSR